MSTHITARLTRHADGWNGHACKDPAANACCVWQMPGAILSEKRDLEAAQRLRSQACSR
jgi:exodeoxyribonuclease V alpha subunit